MSKNVFEKIYNHSSIKKEEYANIINAHSKVNFSKGEFILKEGEMSNSYYLIEKGLFRSYVTDFNGIKITTGFFWQKPNINRSCLFISSNNIDGKHSSTN